MNNSRLVEKIQFFKKFIYNPPRPQICQTHHLPLQNFCIKPNCKDNYILLCEDCTHQHRLFNTNKIVPWLSKYVIKEWSEVQYQNLQIFSQWRNTEINLNYCIDILKQILKQIGQKQKEGKQLLQIPSLEDITQRVYDIFNSYSIESLMDEFSRLNKKYSLLQNPKSQNVKCEQVDVQRHRRLKKNKTIAKESKKFSESALLFSENLARTIEDKIKKQKIIKEVKKLQAQKIVSFAQLNKSQEKLKNIGQLFIELHKQENGKINHSQFQQYLSSCVNLKSIYVNNQNGYIIQPIWQKITNQFQYLKDLTQLKLNLKAIDLRYLIQFFKRKSNAIRHINKLYLKITDQPKLNLIQVAKLCNCLQLRYLYLILLRNNIDKNKMQEFFGELGVYTSLSHLPFIELSINICKNKITLAEDILKVNHWFNQKCVDIRKKSILM